MTILKVKVEYFEELLGTNPANPEIHSEFIASKAPDAESREEEIANIGAEEYEEKSMTVFARNDKGQPINYDYQWKGFFKDSCGMLRRVEGYKSKKLTAFKKVIDGLIFVYPREMRLFQQARPKSLKSTYCKIRCCPSLSSGYPTASYAGQANGATPARDASTSRPPMARSRGRTCRRSNGVACVDS